LRQLTAAGEHGVMAGEEGIAEVRCRLRSDAAGTQVCQEAVRVPLQRLAAPVRVQIDVADTHERRQQEALRMPPQIVISSASVKTSGRSPARARSRICSMR